ncbi:MAG: beta-ketoacyl-ACP synthase 3 [Planctomycetota bacterium]|nr:beta-ketoacyl-ACP synthase 3 [Planctomycetota bacterium]
MTFPHSKIIATGRAVPRQWIENEQVEADCGLEAGWIRRRTGILKRPVVTADQAVSDLAIEAGKQALDRLPENEKNAGIGLLILATSTPDHLLPPTAPLVATELGLGTLPAFDMAVACSGFLYALQVAHHHCLSTGEGVLVIAANVLSKRVARQDAATASLFADGAGAVVVSPSDQPGILKIKLESDGRGADCLKIPDGGSRSPFNEFTLANDNHTMKISNGMAVFKYAVESMSRLGSSVLQEAGVSLEEVDFWIPHQANLRIIDSVADRLGIPGNKTGITIDQFANSSSATLPTALDFYIRQQRLGPGDLVLMTAAAAGLTSGATLFRL